MNMNELKQLAQQYEKEKQAKLMFATMKAYEYHKDIGDTDKISNDILSRPLTSSEVERLYELAFGEKKPVSEIVKEYPYLTWKRSDGQPNLLIEEETAKIPASEYTEYEKMQMQQKRESIPQMIFGTARAIGGAVKESLKQLPYDLFKAFVDAVGGGLSGVQYGLQDRNKAEEYKTGIYKGGINSIVAILNASGLPLAAIDYIAKLIETGHVEDAKKEFVKKAQEYNLLDGLSSVINTVNQKFGGDGNVIDLRGLLEPKTDAEMQGAKFVTGLSEIAMMGQPAFATSKALVKLIGKPVEKAAERQLAKSLAIREPMQKKIVGKVSQEAHDEIIKIIRDNKLYSTFKEGWNAGVKKADQFLKAIDDYYTDIIMQNKDKVKKVNLGEFFNEAENKMLSEIYLGEGGTLKNYLARVKEDLKIKYAKEKGIPESKIKKLNADEFLKTINVDIGELLKQRRMLGAEFKMSPKNVKATSPEEKVKQLLNFKYSDKIYKTLAEAGEDVSNEAKSVGKIYRDVILARDVLNTAAGRNERLLSAVLNTPSTLLSTTGTSLAFLLMKPDMIPKLFTLAGAWLAYEKATGTGVLASKTLQKIEKISGTPIDKTKLAGSIVGLEQLINYQQNLEDKEVKEKLQQGE